MASRRVPMDGKRARFEAQVLPHLDAAYRYARWLMRERSDADDLVQEAMLRAYRGFDALRGTEVRAWLLTIVRNCHATLRTQQQRRAHVPLPDEDDGTGTDTVAASTPDPESELIDRDQQRAFDRLMSTLHAEHREVLMLREVEELSYREIAAVTQLPIGTVMSRLARARAALRSRWLEEKEGVASGVR